MKVAPAASDSTAAMTGLPELLALFKQRIVEPRRTLLRQALGAGGLPGSADLDAIASMLISSF